MSFPTPRQRGGLQRPSFGKTSSPNNFSASTSTVVNRKASLQALSGHHDPQTPNAGTMDANSDLEIGDPVNVPGDMYGTVKFIGSVRGKSGTFAGVELDREFAARGKNDGDVDGIHYFRTSIPGSGIFLPIHRAERRQSPSVSYDSFPATPSTPSYSTVNGHRATTNGYTPPTPAVPSKFSQSVGPGARPSSPNFKPKRPSLPRPESPLRRQPPSLAPTPSSRNLSQSQRGLSNTPSKTNLRASTNSRTLPSHQTPRSYSRTGSRQGNRPEAVTEEDRTPVGVAHTANGRETSTSSVPSFSQPLRSSSRLGSAGGQDAEIHRLRAELAERDKRLAEQAANLADMDASVRELSALMPADGFVPSAAKKRLPDGENDDETSAQLRQMLREKNEKITLLTSEFDAHRADFRSTLDSLEMASTETERVYEEQKRELLGQNQELNERIQELEELSQSKKEVDDVARQLKALEDFVQELEEGLEDARRGEAEARGEVEFLRGEVERGRSELKREREKAAAAINGSSGSLKELEQKDDEIRGLKAIIHSFSTNQSATTNGNAFAKDQDELQKLQTALDESQKEKESLEQEIEQLRRDSALGNGYHQRNESELTEKATTPARPRAETVKATFAEHARRTGLENALPSEENHHSEMTHKAPVAMSSVFCEMCQSREHDTLDCTELEPNNHEASTDEAGSVHMDHAQQQQHHQQQQQQHQPPLHSPGKETEAMGGGKTADGADDKWCALCEKDGHLAYECPDEQY